MARSPASELEALAAAGLHRQLRQCERCDTGLRTKLGDRMVVNFSSNDYLGLASHPSITAAFSEAVNRWGAGSGASRLVCGTMAPHTALEEDLARFKGTESALSFSSGYTAAVGTLSALLQPGDIVILDKLCHASLIDGARLSGAEIRVFPHNDLDQLEKRLAWASGKITAEGRILVVTESVFSMDGDRAPLAGIISAKQKYGALLLVDEAHAFGILGPGGRGLAAELGLSDHVDLQLGTLSKAAGLSGGFVAASGELCDLLVNRSRAFIYSTAPAPALAETARTSLSLLAGAEGDQLRSRLRQHLDSLSAAPGGILESAIFPVILGSNERALAAAAELLEEGFLVPAIRYPTVPRGSARLRVTLSAAHEASDVTALAATLASRTD